jgi:hypothetical protein
VTSKIQFDTAKFDPWRIQPVTHTLMDHRLFALSELRQLGQRLDAQDQVRIHTDGANAATPFGNAPKLFPADKRAGDVLEDVDNAGVWMSLLNVQIDPIYRGLVDEVLDGARSMISAKDPGMCYRGGWIFVTSPNAVTPFHIDFEHNFILQVKGKKRVYTWDPLDRSVVPERGLELFFTQHSRELVRFTEELREKATVFDLEPGQGAYMPSTTPHMVENANNASVTVSFTYYTDATRRRHLAYKGKNHLRRLHLNPTPFGQSELADKLTYGLMRGYSGAKDRALRLMQKPVYPTNVPYAFHLTS